MKVLDYTDPVETQVEPTSLLGIVVGQLAAITGDGTLALVTFPGSAEPGAVEARSTVDLQGVHVGRSVVLIFEQGDKLKPIVVGVLRDAADGWPVDKGRDRVRLEADGQRFIVTAKDELVLRCGKASITLTSSGKILIEGTYLSSRSSGVNRIKGGSIQLN